MSEIVNMNPEHHWYCPKCNFEDVTYEREPHTRFHSCPVLKLSSIPMVPKGTKANLIVNYREDYLGKDLAVTDENGRVVMSITIERENGFDCTVYCPTAVIDFKSLNA